MAYLPAVFSLLFALTAAAADYDCPWPNEARAFTGEISPKDADKDIRVASDFMMAHKDKVAFEYKAAAEILASLERVYANSFMDPKRRSEAYRIGSGVYGLISKKLNSPAASNCGKNSIHFLKQALSLNPENQLAIIGYAKAVHGFNNHSFSFFIARSLDLNLQAEARASLSHMQNLAQVDQEMQVIYTQLCGFAKSPNCVPLAAVAGNNRNVKAAPAAGDVDSVQAAPARLAN